MKTTMKTYEVIDLCTCLETIVMDKTRKMPGNIAWNLMRTYKAISPIKADFEEIQQNKIMEMHEDGKTSDINEEGMINVSPEYMQEYADYINSIVVTDAEIEIYPLSQDNFDKLLQSCELSIPEVDALSKLVEEEDE